jgi:glutathione S-transferase
VKLFYSPTSPFVRKVMACAIARGIDGHVETIRANPHESPPPLLEANPLSKVPCLIADDGMALFDSPVICEFLDGIGDTAKLFPPAGPGRWRALKQQALGDGILDAAVGRRGEMSKPSEAARQAWMARQKAAVGRSLAQLETDPPHDGLDIGTITVACALGYLDFRFGAEPWREACPQLADWFARIAEQPAIARTAPKEG